MVPAHASVVGVFGRAARWPRRAGRRTQRASQAADTSDCSGDAGAASARAVDGAEARRASRQPLHRAEHARTPADRNDLHGAAAAAAPWRPRCPAPCARTPARRALSFRAGLRWVVALSRRHLGDEAARLRGDHLAALLALACVQLTARRRCARVMPTYIRRRSSCSRCSVSSLIVHWRPFVVVELEGQQALRSRRSASRAATPGPSRRAASRA